MEQQQSEKTQPLLAMIALNTPLLPSPAAITKSFEILSGISVDLSSLQSKEGNIVFELGNDNAAVALMPTAIPWSNLEGPCATAWWWPEAAEHVNRHKSHILVALVGKKGNTIQRSMMLTHLTAAVAANTDAAGIYWGGGALIHEPQAFVEQAKQLSPDDLPLYLWIDFRMEQNDAESIRLYTTGMKVFDQKEIEIPRSTKSAAEILDFAYSIAAYVLTSDKTIQDGETIGRTEEEKVQVTFAPSMWDAETTVMQLDF